MALARVTPNECHGIVYLLFRSPPFDQESILRLDTGEDWTHYSLKTKNVPFFKPAAAAAAAEPSLELNV